MSRLGISFFGGNWQDIQGTYIPVLVLPTSVWLHNAQNLGFLFFEGEGGTGHAPFIRTTL